MALGRIEEALDCCNRCLGFDKDNNPMRTVRDRASKVKEEIDRKENERLERLRIEQEQKMRMKVAFQVTTHLSAGRNARA